MRPGTYIPQAGKLSSLSFANPVLASRFWVITEPVYIIARDAVWQILRAPPHSSALGHPLAPALESQACPAAAFHKAARRSCGFVKHQGCTQDLPKPRIYPGCLNAPLSLHWCLMDNCIFTNLARPGGGGGRGVETRSGGAGAILKRALITQPSNNTLVHMDQGTQIALTCLPERGANFQS